MSLLENKARIYDASLIVAGTAQAYKISDIPNNIIIKLIEEPISSLVGIMTFILVTARVIRVIQKILNKNNEELKSDESIKANDRP